MKIRKIIDEIKANESLIKDLLKEVRKARRKNQRLLAILNGSNKEKSN